MNSSLPSQRMTTSDCANELVFGGRLRQPSTLCQTVLVFTIIITILTFPFTAALNALVVIAVKSKRRLKTQKPNILLALLAFNDLVVALIVQPTFVSLIITFLIDEPSGYCAMRVLKPVISSVTIASFIHLALVCGERYIAMKHPFQYFTIVTEGRLLLASAFAWLVSVIAQISNFSYPVFLRTNRAISGLCVAFMVYCHVIVYLEIRRHEKQLAVQQDTRAAREQFLKDKKALKLTTIMTTVLVLCSIPGVPVAVLLSENGSEVSLETRYMLFCLSATSFLNSLFNPIIYSVRMRQFRVAFVELLCRKSSHHRS